MNTKKLVISAAAAAGLLALGSVSFAAAQTADDSPGNSGSHGTMAGHEQMGNHAGMAGHEAMSGNCQGGEQHTQMHEAAATALGITVDEFDARLASGKTIADIAAANGIDLDTVRDTMHQAHSEGHGAGMNHTGMHATN